MENHGASGKCHIEIISIFHLHGLLMALHSLFDVIGDLRMPSEFVDIRNYHCYCDIFFLLEMYCLQRPCWKFDNYGIVWAFDDLRAEAAKTHHAIHWEVWLKNMKRFTESFFNRSQRYRAQIRGNSFMVLGLPPHPSYSHFLCPAINRHQKNPNQQNKIHVKTLSLCYFFFFLILTIFYM